MLSPSSLVSYDLVPFAGFDNKPQFCSALNICRHVHIVRLLHAAPSREICRIVVANHLNHCLSSKDGRIATAEDEKCRFVSKEDFVQPANKASKLIIPRDDEGELREVLLGDMLAVGMVDLKDWWILVCRCDKYCFHVATDCFAGHVKRVRENLVEELRR